MEGGEERGVLRTGKPKRVSQPTSERRGRRLKSDGYDTTSGSQVEDTTGDAARTFKA